MKLNENCPCKRLKCERHGDCDACNEYHRTVNTKYKTACERLRSKEEKKEKKNARER